VITPGNMTGDIMKLTVLERLLLLNILPAEGSYTNLKLLREAKENLSFTEEENRELGFRQQADQIIWNEFQTINKATGKKVEGDPALVSKMINKNPDTFDKVSVVGEKEIDIGEVVTQIIVKELKKLNDGEKLKNEHVSLYEKFIG